MDNKKLYEEMNFDSYAFAQDVMKEAEQRIKDIEAVKQTALIATVCGAAGILLSATPMGLILIVSFILALKCYKQVGGFGVAAKWAGKVAKLGWIIAPFPFDLATFPIVFLLSYAGLFFFPYFIMKNLAKQAQIDLEAANKYMKYCSSQTTASSTI